MAKSGNEKMPGKLETLNRIRRFYLFHGPNAYRLSERVSSLIKAVVPPGGEAFDIDRFDGRRCDVAEVINVVSTPPVLSPLRVAVLADVDRMPGKRQEMLLKFLPRIPEYSVLAMTAVKADRRSKFFKTVLAEKKSAFEYKEFTIAEAAAMVIGFGADRKKEIKPQVAEIMVGLFGVDPFRLENEVEKISLSVGSKKTIEKKDLAFVSGYGGSETAYDLPVLTFSGRLREALELCGRAMSSGINEMQVLYLYRNHLLAMNAACNSKDIKSLMSVYRIRYEVAKQIQVQAGKIGPQGILDGLRLLFRAEYALKSARFPSPSIIELLVVALYQASVGNKN